MQEREAETLYRLGALKSAMVLPAAMDEGRWYVLFDIEPRRATDSPAWLERTPRAGGGVKTFASVERAVFAASACGLGSVSVVVDPLAVDAA